MSEYKILPSQVLIVPGYTNEEIIAMSAKTKDSSASAIKNATSSTDKTKKTNDDSQTKTASNTSSTSSTKNTAAKSRMLKSRKVTAKQVNETLSALKKVLYNPSKGDNHGKNKPNAYYTAIKNKNKSTSKNYLDKDAYLVNGQYVRTSITKTTAKTKTTKKTSKASKKKKTTSKTTKSKAGSSQTDSKKSSKSSKNKNTVNESSAAIATESQIKVEKPKALLFSPTSVDYTPHRKDYEEFNSADGLILIEKACDQFAELQLSLDVHQAMRIQENGTIELSSDDKRPIDIITEGAPTILDPATELGHFIDPAEFTDSYVEIRRGFFDKYIGRPLTLVSDLFPTIAVCYITDISYNINEGEEQAEYSITFREVDNTWG